MIAEVEVARVAGVSRERLREIRKGMAEGLDFAREVGGAVMLSGAGVDRVEEALGVDLGVLRAVIQWSPGLRTLRVRQVLRNRRVVLAEFVERSPWAGSAQEAERVPDGVVRLVVHDSARLFAGAILDARWVEEDVWEMVGRGPRSRMDAVRLSQQE